MDIELSSWELQMKVYGIKNTDSIHRYSLWASDYNVYLSSLKLYSDWEAFSIVRKNLVWMLCWEDFSCHQTMLMHANVYRLIALPEVVHGSLGVLKNVKTEIFLGHIGKIVLIILLIY